MTDIVKVEKNVEQIIIKDSTGLKSYLIDNCIFFFDIILFILLCSYVKHVGINNISITEFIFPFLFRIIYSSAMYKLDNKIETATINKFIMHKLVAFLVYMLFMFSYKATNNETLNNAIGAYIIWFTLLISLIFVIKTIINEFRGIKKDKIDDINKYLNIIFLISFSFLLSSSNFNELINIIFNSSINAEIINQFKDFNLYLTIIFIFFITYARTENIMIFNYGRKINSTIVFATFIVVLLHIYNNIQNNSINYSFISYLMIVMITTIAVINIIIDYDASANKKIFYAGFKFFFITYTAGKGLGVISSFFMDFVLYAIVSIAGCKSAAINIGSLKLIRIMNAIVFLFLIFTILKNDLNNIEGNKIEYLGLFAIMAVSSMLPSRNYGHINEYKKIIKSLFKVFYFNYIHESIRIKNETIKHKGYLNVKEKIISAILAVSIYIIVVHYFIVVALYLIKQLISLISEKFIGFLTYVTDINEITSPLLVLMGTLKFQFIFIFILCTIAYFVMRIFFTNERVLLLSSLNFQYVSYNYNELTIKYNNNKCYLYRDKNRLYYIRHDKIKKYLEKKIKESLKLSENTEK